MKDKKVNPKIYNLLSISLFTFSIFTTFLLYLSIHLPNLIILKNFDYLTTRFSQNYFNNNFLLRSEIINLHALIKYKGLGVSPTDRVLVGKSNWLFLGNFGSNLDYIRKKKLFSENELKAWKKLLEKRSNWLEKRGIYYVFVITPNKSSIYPEYLPNNINVNNKYSRLDQLIDYLRENSHVNIIDLRPTLIEAKSKYKTYYETDTHWNQIGGYLGYYEIVSHLKKEFSSIQQHTTIGNIFFQANSSKI